MAELMKRLESAVRLATSEFLSSTESIRSRINHPNMPSETTLSGHVDKLKPKWLEDLGGVFQGIQAVKLSDQYALNELKDRIFSAVSPCRS
jgi:hypothetical protein